MDGDWSLTVVSGVSENGTASAYANDRLFTGHPLDVETGMVYARWRYYLPLLGVWISRDPEPVTATENLYAYVSGNPIGSVDPQGTKIYVKGGHSWNLHTWMQNDAVDFRGEYSFNTSLNTDTGMTKPDVRVGGRNAGEHGLIHTLRTMFLTEVRTDVSMWGPEIRQGREGEKLSCVGSRTRIDLLSDVTGAAMAVLRMGGYALNPARLRAPSQYNGPSLAASWHIFSIECAVCNPRENEWQYYGGSSDIDFNYESSLWVLGGDREWDAEGTYDTKRRGAWYEAKDLRPLDPIAPRVRYA
jgi:RHS repeat-associated protein